MYQPTYQVTDRILMDLVKLEIDKAHLENIEQPTPVQKNLELKSRSVIQVRFELTFAASVTRNNLGGYGGY